MSLGPIDNSLIIERVKLAPALGFRQFGGAADLLAAQEAKPTTPSLFVLSARERAQPSQRAGDVLQRVPCVIALVYAVSNVADIRGKAASDALRLVRAPTLQRVIGWSPTVDNAPIQFVGGTLVGFKDQVLWWQDEISSDYYLQGPIS
ncbi:MAG TPA: hypothetical protein VF928_09235 [Usitatibacteraceae bacterium]